MPHTTTDKVLVIVILVLSILGMINAFLGFRVLQKARDAINQEDYDAFYTYMKRSSLHDTLGFSKMIVVLGLLIVLAINKLGG